MITMKIHIAFLLLVAATMAIAGGTDIAFADVSCFHCHVEVVKQFQKNIHYENGLNCADCHGGVAESNTSLISSSAMSGNFIGAPSRLNITAVCSKCHPSEARDYKTSIHWKQLSAGHQEAATCTDCHGVHEIRATKDPVSATYPQNSPETCAKCHASKEMMSAWYYGIKTDRFDTYKESYHWKALSNGYTVVATCADCHGNHDTKAPNDPASATYPGNLPKTCGKEGCHSSAKFDVFVSIGMVHDKESLHTSDLMFNKSGLSPKERAYYLGPFDLAYWVAWFFKILTTGVIGFFIGMVILDLMSRIKIHKRW